MKAILFFMTMTVLLFGQLANAQSVKIKVVQENDRQVMYYDGEIFNPRVSPDLLDTYVHSLRQLRQGKPLFLVINSQGGDRAMAHRISLDMQRICSGDCVFTTIHESQNVCSSACLIVFLSGTERIARDTSMFVIHSGYSGRSGFSTSLEMAADQYWAGMDPVWITNFVKSTGAYKDGRDVVIAGPTNLIQSGLVTEIVSDPTKIR